MKNIKKMRLLETLKGLKKAEERFSKLEEHINWVVEDIIENMSEMSTLNFVINQCMNIALKGDDYLEADQNKEDILADWEMFIEYYKKMLKENKEAFMIKIKETEKLEKIFSDFDA